MDIQSELDVYKFLQLINDNNKSDEGTVLFVEHLFAIGKLEYVKLLFNGAFAVRHNVDIPYLVALEKQLEAFAEAFDMFIREDSNKEKSEESKVVSGFVEPEDFDDFEVQKTNAGIMFSLSNLKFKPDSSVLLDGESQKLIKIAEVLKKLQGSQFLVEGHTASTGNEKGEMSLSLERARSVIAALVKLGVPEQSFICKGSGGTRPVADNSTPEGKAKNRRVEITILE